MVEPRICGGFKNCEEVKHKDSQVRLKHSEMNLSLTAAHDLSSDMEHQAHHAKRLDRQLLDEKHKIILKGAHGAQGFDEMLGVKAQRRAGDRLLAAHLAVVQVHIEQNDGEGHRAGCIHAVKDRGVLGVIMLGEDLQNALNLLGLPLQPHQFQILS